MGYTSKGKLADIFPADFIDDTSHEIVDRVGTRFRDRVAQRTPVARLPQAYKGDFEAWIIDRGGRPPRTMRDSWVKGPIIREGGALGVSIESTDEKAILVEEVTRPHLIRAHLRAGGKQGSLRYPMGPSFHYNVEVWHPGTQGVHMMRDTSAEMAAGLWAVIAEEVIAEKTAEYNKRFP